LIDTVESAAGFVAGYESAESPAVLAEVRLVSVIDLDLYRVHFTPLLRLHAAVTLSVPGMPFVCRRNYSSGGRAYCWHRAFCGSSGSV
jgi:hypothetical protein